MTQTETGRPSGSRRHTADDSGYGAYSFGGTGVGWLWFAAVMLFVAGCHNLIYGISVLDDYAVVTNNLNTDGQANIIYLDTTFWGWTWIGVGIVAIVTAFALPSRNQAARWFAIFLAAANAIGQLAFLAAFPVWSIIIIAIDVLIIYGLLTWDNPRRSAYDPYPDDVARKGERSWEGGYRSIERPAGGRSGSRHAWHGQGATPSGNPSEPGADPRIP